MSRAKITICMGSQSDWPTMKEAVAILGYHNAIERSLVAAEQEIDLALKSLSGLDDSALKSALISAALFSVKRSY